MLAAPWQLEFKDGRRRAHLVGIGGSGMRALASVLVASGWQITGSDASAANQRELAALNIDIKRGHRSDHVPQDAHALIYSDAIPPDNPERRQAEQLGIPAFSYAAALGKLTRNLQTVAIAGTHGKSTVTALAAEILARAGLDPTVVCGAMPRQLQPGAEVHSIGPFGGRRGAGNIAVLEACEYRENFLHLSPTVAVVLNIEPDHFDYYATNDQLIAAFEKFASRTAADGLVLASADCPTATAVARASGRRIVTFGLGAKADWRAASVTHLRGRYRFDLLRKGKLLTRIALSIPGKHNVANALAAAAIAHDYGISPQQIAQAISAFRGLKRRLDARWTLAEVTWIDDYAHHPTEVAATLATLREMFPHRRICCVFQPHQASRLTALLDEFAQSLHNADSVAVADVFRAREGAQAPSDATAADLAARLRAQGLDVLDEHRPTEIVQRLAEQLQPGDVLATIGAGNLDFHFHEFHERLRRDCSAA